MLCGPKVLLGVGLCYSDINSTLFVGPPLQYSIETQQAFLDNIYYVTVQYHEILNMKSLP